MRRRSWKDSRGTNPPYSGYGSNRYVHVFDAIIWIKEFISLRESAF